MRPQFHFHIHVYVSALYIPRIGPHIFLQQNNRQTDRRNIDKSLTNIWMWKLGLRLRISFSRNFCFEFSILCPCSARQSRYHAYEWWRIHLQSLRKALSKSLYDIITSNTFATKLSTFHVTCQKISLGSLKGLWHETICMYADENRPVTEKGKFY